MAILTSMPGEGNQVGIYDVPDNVLQQYAVSGDKAAQMFPESKTPTGGDLPKSTAAMSATRVENAESLGEVQAYNDVCVCRQLYCNAYRCWWHYYYCYC
ncbi:MAG: hypothetical protein ND866_02225 [Pyrinomonadaceae bacterium]|nr:hypothetical protein [Pyrinomonadaceae bacterium]